MPAASSITPTISNSPSAARTEMLRALGIDARAAARESGHRASSVRRSTVDYLRAGAARRRSGRRDPASHRARRRDRSARPGDAARRRRVLVAHRLPRRLHRPQRPAARALPPALAAAALARNFPISQRCKAHEGHAHATRNAIDSRAALRGVRAARSLDRRAVPAGRHASSSWCMLLLLVASFWSWAVIFDKVSKLRRLRRDAERFEESFWSGGSLDDLYDRVGERPADPMSAVFAAAMREWRRSVGQGPARQRQHARQPAGAHRARDAGHRRARDGPARALHAVPRHGRLDRALRRLVRHGLGHHGQLPVDRRGQEHQPRRGGAGHRRRRCSPPRSGLVAAIPAVVAYNKFSTDFGRYAGRLEAFATEFSAILSRQLDEKA